MPKNRPSHRCWSARAAPMLRQCALIWLCLAPLSAALAQVASPRFAGSARLTGPATQSSDGRFAMAAALITPEQQTAAERANRKESVPTTASAPAAPKAFEQQGGRFALTAKLNNPEGGTCGAVIPLIFSNGFENTVLNNP